MPGKTLLTGSSGFIGQHWLKKSSYKEGAKAVSLRSVAPEDIDFSGIDTVVHLAGIAHRMDQPTGEIYYEVNRDLTLKLAECARQKGVSYFLFVSTVKVYGDARTHLSLQDDPRPEDDYGQSKWEAEQALLKLQQSGFKVAVLRPPLVYGPGVKGNVMRLMRLLDKGLPLPFGRLSNQRSMVFVDNLTAMMDAMIAQKAEGTFIAGDPYPISTEQMIRHLAEGMGKPVHLFSVPTLFRKLLQAVKPGTSRRLFGDYTIDASTSLKSLNFTPPYSTAEGLHITGKAYSSPEL
jgi:UDP-glucose 4-epimerase